MGVCITIYRVGQKTRLFLTVDNFAAVRGRKACDKVSKYSDIKYLLHTLHKYSLHSKLCRI